MALERPHRRRGAYQQPPSEEPSSLLRPIPFHLTVQTRNQSITTTIVGTKQPLSRSSIYRLKQTPHYFLSLANPIPTRPAAHPPTDVDLAEPLTVEASISGYPSSPPVNPSTTVPPPVRRATSSATHRRSRSFYHEKTVIKARRKGVKHIQKLRVGCPTVRATQKKKKEKNEILCFMFYDYFYLLVLVCLCILS